MGSQFQSHNTNQFCGQIKWEKQNIQDLEWATGSLSTKTGRWLLILEQRLPIFLPGFKQP